MTTSTIEKVNIRQYLRTFQFVEKKDFFLPASSIQTTVEPVTIGGKTYRKYINEYWTSRQRQSNSIHEIAYRACFKPQLPNFFINLLTSAGDIVYDPFSGRGTTALEAALLDRGAIANDANPLSIILTYPRFYIPKMSDLQKRLDSLPLRHDISAEIDLSMFYHAKTESEIVSLKNYLRSRKETGAEDALDRWIRMIATNRLTGHSSGFFSVYTLPPNQAVSQESQKKINRERRQKPEYRDVKRLILKKSIELTSDIDDELRERFKKVGDRSLFLDCDARKTRVIPSDSVTLTVTSPPFLDVVQYTADNWLRCWFNDIAISEIEKKMTMIKSVELWSSFMSEVFLELYRITRKEGYVAFEVGEVRGGKVKLDEHVVSCGEKAGFHCEGILINLQEFTKTSNIWGIANNKKGTNSNRVVIFSKNK